MSTTTEYVEAVVRRARTPMAPLDWETDWHDQPLRHKVYRDVHRLPLPAGLTPVTASLGSALGSPDPGGVSTLEGLAEMLRHSYGLLERRLRVTGNDDNDRRYWAQNATWARATASGGGLYPLEIYWVTGGDGPVQPGVYHYSSPHHAMQRLLAGDVVDRAPGRPAPDRHRPVPAGQCEILEELVQVQQLQLSRRDDGPRRAAGHLAALGSGDRTRPDAGVVVRRRCGQRSARTRRRW